MEDLTSCIEIVQYVVEPEVSSPGEWFLTPFAVPPEASIRVGKKCSKKHLKFWRVVSNTIRYFIKIEIKEILRAWLGTRFFELLVVVKIFSWVVNVLTAFETEPCKIETSRDPPLVFIPIPKLVESNGCARSDLDPFAYF